MDPIFDKARALLKTNQGLAIGDVHGQEAINNWIITNLPKFKQENTRIIFLETMYVLDQPTIDGFLRREPLSEQRMDAFFANFYSAGWGESDYNIVKSARDQGIEIVALEEGRKASIGDEGLKISNAQWHKRILERISTLAPGEKYLVIAGGRHTQPREGVPGIDARLGIPSIDLTDMQDVSKNPDFFPTIPANIAAVANPTLFMGDGIENNFVGLLPTAPGQRDIQKETGLSPLIAISARSPELMKPFIEISQLESQFSLPERQALRALKLDIIFALENPGHPVSAESLGSLQSIARVDAKRAAAIRTEIQAIP